MFLYDLLIELTRNQYDKIHIDLKEKTIKVGKQTIIKCGNIEQYKIKVGEQVYEFDELIKEKLDIDGLYKQYKYSVPSERDCGKTYFKALSANELTDAQLVLGMQRLEARVRLEAYLLLAVLTGIEKWENDSHWYWQGKDKDFIILKQYM